MRQFHQKLLLTPFQQTATVLGRKWSALYMQLLRVVQWAYSREILTIHFAAKASGKASVHRGSCRINAVHFLLKSPFVRDWKKNIADIQWFAGSRAGPFFTIHCPRRPAEGCRNSPLRRAEYAGRCAVKSPMCDEKPKRSGGFVGALWHPLFKIVGEPPSARQNRA